MFNPQAERAYKLADGQASRVAHQNANTTTLLEDGHWKPSNKYMSNAVSGGIYGTLFTLASVAAVVGAHLDVKIALIVGFGTLVAGSFGLAIGKYTSSSTTRAFAQLQQAREQWEFDNYLEGEKREMVEIYEHKGFSSAEASTVIDILSRNKEFFVDHMLVYELEIMPPDPRYRPLWQALATFAAFLCCGFVVMIPFMAMLSFDSRVPFSISCGIAAIAAVVLGTMQGRFATRAMIPTGVFSLIHFLVTVGFAFLFGYLVHLALP